MDSLHETPTLPELSFDDLLDESPIKRFRTRSISDDRTDTNNISLKDQSLHTPGPKRKLNQLNQTSSITKTDNVTIEGEIIAENKSSTAIVTASSNQMSTIAASSAQLSEKAGVSSPVLLNNKIALNFVSSKPPQKVVKITTATGKALGAAGNTLWPQTMGRVTTFGGKTVIKTANGQIVYLQKAPTAPATVSTAGTAAAAGSCATIPTPAATATVRLSTVSPTKQISNISKGGTIINTKINSESASTSTSTNAAGGGNKTLAIQFVRSADGKLVPIKSTAAGVKNALTLSPTVAAQFAGTKIVTSTGNQVIFKAATTGTGATIKAGISTPTTAASSNVSSTQSLFSSTKPPLKIQKIMAPSASVLAKNPSTNILNAKTVVPPSTAPSSTSIVNAQISSTSTIAPAASVTAITAKHAAQTTPVSPSTTAGGKLLVQGTNGKQIVVTNSQLIKLSPKSNSSLNSSGGQVHAIQLPGKPRFQYVRVLPAPKKTTIISEASTAAAAKLLNAMPPNKLDIVRTNAVGGGGKFVLTSSPKVEASGSGGAGTTILSPSKVQKTIVTVPTIRNISYQEKNLTNASETPTMGISSSGSSSKVTNMPMALTVLRPKSKILDINSEIKRMTTTTVSGGGGAAAGDVTKRVVSGADGKRYVVIQKPQQQLQKTLTQTPKVIVKSGSLVSGAASTAESAMKSFIICKSNQSQHQNSEQNSDATLGTNVIQLKKPPLHQQQQQQQQQHQNQQILSIQQKQQQQQQQKPLVLDDNSSNSLSITTGNGIQFTSTTTNNNLSKFLPIKIKEELLDIDDMNSINFTDDPLARGGVRRKHCNCSKSQCLKLYCDCFANGEFCQDCTCKDCFNSLHHEDERLRAIRSCLERNPSAFKPKITSAADQGDARLHNKGCNCKRSGCLKNYCECFEAKIPCSNNCKCVGCRNIEDRPDLDMDPIDPKILETIANASNATNNIARAVSNVKSVKRNYENASESDVEGKRRRSSNDGAAALLATTQLSDDEEDSSKYAAEKRSANFITQEVIDATIQCMISQADECLKSNLPAHQIEKMVIEELGRCLVEIIDFSIRNTDNSFTQN